MYKPIHKFRFWTNPAIPTVYGEALSYMEDVSKVRYKLNEVIAAYNELIEYYNSLDGLLGEIQSALSEATAKIEELEQKTDAALKELDEKFDTLQSNIDAEFSALKEAFQNEVQAQMSYLEQQIKLIKQEISGNNEQLQQWVNDRLQQFLESLPDVQDVLVTDPTTGKTVTISEALGNILDYRNEKINMWNPQTGIYGPQSDVITQNYLQLMECGALTAGEFDSLGITAEEYDNAMADLVHADWYSNRIYPKIVENRLENEIEKEAV